MPQDKPQTRAQKIKELAVYIFFGVLTTLVNLAVYQGLEWLLQPVLGDHSYLLSQIIGFIAALVFAFVVNKLFVFQQKSWEKRTAIREAVSFAGARLFSFGLDTLLMFLCFDLLWPKVSLWFTPFWQAHGVFFVPREAYRFVVKWCFIAVLVVILNYFFGKFIFQKKGRKA